MLSLYCPLPRELQVQSNAKRVSKNVELLLSNEKSHKNMVSYLISILVLKLR